MKQLKTIELTGYEPIDAKLVAGYGLFDCIECEFDPSASLGQMVDNLGTPYSILRDLYNLEETNLNLAKSILCKRFHYRELRFTEDIFVATNGNPPIILTTKSKKSNYNNDRCYLNRYLYGDDRREERLKNYLLGLEFYATAAHLDFGSIFFKFPMATAIITALLAILSYPLIGAINTILIMLITTYAFMNLMRNMATLMELELEELDYHYE